MASFSRRRRRRRLLSVRAEGAFGGCAAVGGSSPSPSEDMRAWSRMDSNPRCFGRCGDSGMGVDYEVGSVIALGAISCSFNINTHRIASPPLAWPIVIVIAVIILIWVRPRFSLLTSPR